MAVLPIILWPDPRLSQVCRAVEPGDDVATLAADMLLTMYDAPGRGLAAPQVGVLMRLFVIDVTWKEGTPLPKVLINPAIIAASDEKAVGPEVCLSIPDVTARVLRSTEITIRWTDLQGRECCEMLRGAAAICAQHEMDHLDGLVTFDRLPKAEREAALAGYLA